MDAISGKKRSNIKMSERWTEERPWGRFLNLLESPETKVKLIEVDPQKRLSYQSHEKRSENWTIISGMALVTLNEEDVSLKNGDHIFIPAKAKHRIKNSGSDKLRFIEVQTGDYFGEDDIRRYGDDFKRN